MPANYAHYRFGKLVLPMLPSDVRSCIQRFRRMFDMGLHGPDLFFYYNPFLKTAVGAFGKTFHRQSGQEFFSNACRAANSEAARAYLYGLLGHYCLDSICHPYVQKIADIGECSHTALESEFDRYLLALDKVPSPHTYDMSKRMHLTRGECMSVAAFYPGATGANISQCVKSMAFFSKFFAHPNRKRTQWLVHRFSPAYMDQLIPEAENESLLLYRQELKALYDQALANYPQLLSQLLEHLEQEAPLGEDFSRNFG